MNATNRSKDDGVAVVRRVFDAVLVEMRRNPDFAQRVSAAIAGAPSRRGGGRRAPAAFDPLALWRERPSLLEERLRELSVDQLKDIVSHYGLDPSRLALKWKSADRLMSLIIESSEARARKGEAFRPPAPATTEPGSPDVILNELHLLVEVAGTDLLDSDSEVTFTAVRDWAQRADVTIRTYCGSSYAAVFKGKGRGLAPRDELNTKLAYILDDLVPKARGGLLS